MRTPNLYWLKNKNDIEKGILVDKIENNRYRVLEFGRFYPILNHGYLVHNSIAEILQKYVPEQMGLVNKVVIWRKSTDEIWSDYSEIEIKNQFDLQSFSNAEFDGLRLYHLMYDQIYISSELKEKLILECRKIDEIEFSNEWPLYG